MSTITASNPASPTTSPQRFRRGLVLAVSAVVVIAAVIAAVTVWLLVQSPTQHTKVTAPPLTNVQQFGAAGQGDNTICAPAPGTRLC